jgi:hypothetical protein
MNHMLVRTQAAYLRAMLMQLDDALLRDKVQPIDQARWEGDLLDILDDMEKQLERIRDAIKDD